MHAENLVYNLVERLSEILRLDSRQAGGAQEQKKILIKGVTDLLQNVLGKNPKTTVVVIDEVNTDNWGIAGECVTELRKRAE